MKVAFAVFNILIIFSLAFWSHRKYAEQSVKLYWSVLSIKIVAGIALGLLYQYHYTSDDTWTFFNEATQLSALARKNFFNYFQFLFSASDTTVDHVLYVHDRSLLFIKIISFFCLVSSDNYWICTGYFALFSFFASWLLYRQVVKLLPDSSVAVGLALFFFPSVVFWSSGLVKETLALSGLYLLTTIFLKFASQEKIDWHEWLVALLSLALAWWLKYYWAAVFVMVLVTSVIIILLNRRAVFSRAKIIFNWLVLFFLICFAASFTHPNFYLSRFLEVLVSNHDQFIKISRPENVIHYYQLKPAWWSVLLNAPLAEVSGFFRPFFWEASNGLSMASSIENLFLLLMAISFFGKTSTYSDHYKSWLLPILVYCFFLCLFLALSTPNFGTLSRYRVGFLPFFVFALAYRNPLLKYLIDRLPFFTK
jgi:hypothetical protein